MFKWDYSLIQAILDKEKEEDKIYEFHINISTDYLYDKGWVGNDERDIYLERTKDELAYRGYKVQTEDGGRYIKKDNNYCYLHPMDWSGYGTKKFIDEMVATLKDTRVVRHIHTPLLVQMLPIDVKQYEELILANMDNLTKFFKLEAIAGGDVGMQFVTRYRPNVIFDTTKPRGVISSSDRDVVIINELYRRYGLSLYLDKTDDKTVENNIKDNIKDNSLADLTQKLLDETIWKLADNLELNYDQIAEYFKDIPKKIAEAEDKEKDEVEQDIER